jgi:hypothetical protein
MTKIDENGAQEITQTPEEPQEESIESQEVNEIKPAQEEVSANDTQEQTGISSEEASSETEGNFDFELPEGFEPGNYFESFRQVANELGLDQAKAQQLVSFWADVAKDVETSTKDAWQEARRDWATMTLKDSELGGNNLEHTFSMASKVVERFGNEGLREVLLETGLSNHPEVIRFIVSVGKSMGEDTFQNASHMGSGGEKTAAQLIYGRA